MRALVLNSTQAKQPQGDLAWVRATLAAVEALASQHAELVVSVGTTPWELVLWKAVQTGARLHVLCPVARKRGEQEERALLEHQFGLCSELCSWQFLSSQGRSLRQRDTWLKRDALAFELAHKVVPISVRPGGRMHQWLQRQDVQPRVEEQFVVPYDHPKATQGWQLPGEATSSLQGGPWLLHFTRSSAGPWPGETKAQFYEAIARSQGRYPRDGWATLQRIVQEGRLRASEFRIRGGTATVSFTALEPQQAIRLIRWRRRYARYAFEPYAIALTVEAAACAGARAVLYDKGPLEGSDAFRQGRGEQGHWEAEQEWRFEGDVDLRSFDRSSVVVLTATAAEATELAGNCPFSVRSFGCR